MRATTFASGGVKRKLPEALAMPKRRNQRGDGKKQDVFGPKSSSEWEPFAMPAITAQNDNSLQRGVSMAATSRAIVDIGTWASTISFAIFALFAGSVQVIRGIFQASDLERFLEPFVLPHEIMHAFE